MSSGDTSKGFTGTISLRLTDLIQMVCLSRSDLVIGVTSRRGEGLIHIRRGRIHHAQTRGAIGEEAFLEILRWNDGKFEILPYTDNGLETVHKPWEHLLLEAIRSQDENLTPDNGETALIFDEIDHLFGEGAKTDEEPAAPDVPAATDVPAAPDVLAATDVPSAPDVPPAPEELRAPKRVLVVDDSTFFARRLKDLLEAEGDIEVAGVAKNGTEALKFLESGTPVDLVTLDVEMPVMPGDTTLKHIMIRHRVPVLIVSSIQPDSMGKLFDFLQLGAVEFFAKPAARDDLDVVGAKLRALARGAAGARVDHFRRLRRKTGEAPAAEPAAASGAGKLLVVVGGEGAHMDWLRLPLGDLCRRWIVLGLQKLPEPFIPAFARLVEEKTGVAASCLSGGERLEPGRVYFGSARRNVEFRFSGDGPVDVEVLESGAPDWNLGLERWLDGLADVGGDRVAFYFSSAVDSLPDDTVTRLLARGPSLVLAPSTSVLCGGLVDGIRPFSNHFPGLVCCSSPERLPEVLK